MTPVTAKPYVYEFATSKDGTVIAYRRFGAAGPGLVLNHGGMQTSQSFVTLATLLSDAYTVLVPDRRDRGRSRGGPAVYDIERACEDVDAVLQKTGAHDVFGLSSGAVITLNAALRSPNIRRIAVYEPPMPYPGQPSQTEWMEKAERAIAAGELATAMSWLIHGTGDDDLMQRFPRLALVPLFAFAIRAEAGKKSDDFVPLGELIPTFLTDMHLVKQMTDRLDDFRAVKTPTLLMGGERSAAWLKEALSAVERTLPTSRRVLLPNIGHIAADNSGTPGRVAEELRRFFT